MFNFLKNLMLKKREKALAKDKDYGKLVDKYNLIDFDFNDSPEERKRKEILLKEREKKEKKKTREINERRKKNELAKERKKKAKKKAQLIEKYGKELGTRISKGVLWIGMSEEALKELKGKPGKKTQTISRNKKREEQFYDGYMNRQGNMTYRLKVVLTNGIVDKWTSD